MLIGEDTAMLEKITIGIYIVVPLLHMLPYPTFGLLPEPL